MGCGCSTRHADGGDLMRFVGCLHDGLGGWTGGFAVEGDSGTGNQIEGGRGRGPGWSPLHVWTAVCIFAFIRSFVQFAKMQHWPWHRRLFHKGSLVAAECIWCSALCLLCNLLLGQSLIWGGGGEGGGTLLWLRMKCVSCSLLQCPAHCPCGVHSLPAGSAHIPIFSAGCEFWRVHTTKDVGTVTQSWGFQITQMTSSAHQWCTAISRHVALGVGGGACSLLPPPPPPC